MVSYAKNMHREKLLLKQKKNLYNTTLVNGKYIKLHKM